MFLQYAKDESKRLYLRKESVLALGCCIRYSMQFALFYMGRCLYIFRVFSYLQFYRAIFTHPLHCPIFCAASVQYLNILIALFLTITMKRALCGYFRSKIGFCQNISMSCKLARLQSSGHAVDIAARGVEQGV